MQHQRFDITALMASVGEMHKAIQERGVVKVPMSCCLECEAYLASAALVSTAKSAR